MSRLSVDACPEISLLRDLAAGRLRDELEAQLFRHLGNCERCNQEFESLDQTVRMIQQSAQNPPPADEVLDEEQLVDTLTRLAEITVRQPKGETELETIAPEDQHGFGEDLQPGDDFGPYRILEKLGQGGMGIVFRATHTRLQREVAIKLLPTSRLISSSSIARFEREMNALGRVQHPNVIVAHDAGQIDDQYFIAMEYVEGHDLEQVIAGSDALPIEKVCRWIAQAAKGLQHAHEQGLVHRDIKPGNLLLDANGVVKVLDLGLARIETKTNEAFGKERLNDLTDDGVAMGTLGFMSPEQALDAAQVDPRTDIYSLGVTLFKLLSGRMPFPREQFDTAGKMLVAITTKTPPSLATVCPELPTKVTALVDQMLARDPEKRIQTAAEVSRQLQAIADAIRNRPTIQRSRHRLKARSRSTRNGWRRIRNPPRDRR